MKPLWSVQEMLHLHDVAFALLPEKYGSPAARLLVALTCEHESWNRRHFRQVRGPALLPHQIEPATLKATWQAMGWREREIVRAAAGYPGTNSTGPDLAESLVNPMTHLARRELMVMGAVYSRLVYWHGTRHPIPSVVALQPRIWVDQLSRYYKLWYNRGGKAQRDALVTAWMSLESQGVDMITWATGGTPGTVTA